MRTFTTLAIILLIVFSFTFVGYDSVTAKSTAESAPVAKKQEATRSIIKEQPRPDICYSMDGKLLNFLGSGQVIEMPIIGKMCVCCGSKQLASYTSKLIRFDLGSVTKLPIEMCVYRGSSGDGKFTYRATWKGVPETIVVPAGM
jgi:hypothetical protein